MDSKPLLGVIGGLGPLATACFLEQLTAMTDAPREQDHLEVLLYSCPSLPDRTRAILDPGSPSPLPGLQALGKKLAGQGAACIAIPCMTAHYFYDRLEFPVPCIHAIRETALHLLENGISSAGILATDGTVKAGLFSRELEALGIRPILPGPEDQARVMELIYGNIKAGLAPDMEKFRSISSHLRQQGAQAIVLGCTELSLIHRDYPLGPGYLDAMEVLARRAILTCGGVLKPRYRVLLTK